KASPIASSRNLPHPVHGGRPAPCFRRSQGSSPRNNRSTAAVICCRDILPPPPGDAAPDSCGHSASPRLVSMFCCCLSIWHLSDGNRPLTRCPNQPCGGGP